jgi:hypothetical protein
MFGVAAPDVRPLWAEPLAALASGIADLPEETDDEGVAERALTAASNAFPMLMAPRALRAVEEPLRDMLVGTPFTSFSVSEVASRLTNSFCSN